MTVTVEIFPDFVLIEGKEYSYKEAAALYPWLAKYLKA